MSLLEGRLHLSQAVCPALFFIYGVTGFHGEKVSAENNACELPEASVPQCRQAA